MQRAATIRRARARYAASNLALRIAEWEATGGPSGNVLRPTTEDGR